MLLVVGASLVCHKQTMQRHRGIEWKEGRKCLIFLNYHIIVAEF